MDAIGLAVLWEEDAIECGMLWVSTAVEHIPACLC